MDNSMVGLCGWRKCQGSLKQGWVPALPSPDVLKPSHGSFTHMPETGTHDTFLVMKPLHVASAQEPPSSPLRRNHYPNSCVLTTLHSPGPLCPPGQQTCLQTPRQSQPASSAWRALTDTCGRQLTGPGAKVKHQTPTSIATLDAPPPSP